MLLAIHKRNSPSAQCEEFKDRLRISGLVPNFRFSFDSKKSSPDRSPFLSSSTSLTPTSQPFSARKEENSFLTALDVRDDNEEANYLLSNHVGLVYGDNVIPPPPPRKSSSSSLRLKFPLKAEFGNSLEYLEPRRKKNGLDRCKDTCFICNDTLDSKMDSERILVLSCGDRIHSECLDINVECAIEYAIDLGMIKPKQPHPKLKSLIFPICEGAICKQEQKKCPASPIDDEYVSKTLTGATLKIKLSAVNPDLGLPGKNPKVHAQDMGLPGADLTLLDSPRTESLKSLSTVGCRESQYFVKDNTTLRSRPQANTSSQRSFSFALFEMRPPSTRMSFASAAGEEEDVTIEQLKSYFLQHFVNIHPRVDMVFVMSLGSVRLVDRLNVAIDGARFSPQTVYLFAEYIAIINEGLHPMLFPLNDECVISTPKTSVFQFASRDANIPTLKLHSDEDAIIEKWGIVVSDKLLLIPVELFTSTIMTSELKYTSFKPTLADLGLNIVGEKSTIPKLKISPIYEMEQESSSEMIHASPYDIIEDSPMEVYLPEMGVSSGRLNLEKEFIKIGLLGSPFPQRDVDDSRPISPLRIFKSKSLSNDSSDSDTDSDEELIEQHRTLPK